MSPKGPRLVLRVLVVLLIDAVALMLLGAVLPGFDVGDFWDALVMAAVIGLLNALVWPSLARFTVPLSTLTLGGVAIVLNAALVLVAAAVSPGANLTGVWSGIAVVVGMSALTALVLALLAIEDDESWQRNVVARQARKRDDYVESDVPGVVFLEIDGLAHDVLRRAIRDGNAPALARWLRTGTHRLERWETDWSSQTGACQAGILHGSNFDMPAFRWWEKDRGKPIVTNHPRDAEELERRRSDGKGLLHDDGASRANILSGDAPHSSLTMSTVMKRRGPIGRDYSAYFARPYAVARTFILWVVDYARERRAQAQQRRRDVQPRIARSRVYAAVRAYATVIQRDLQVAVVIGDVLAGRPVIYSTFLAYDEVAHHSGLERHDALAVLASVDRQIERVEQAIADAPRPYRIVVLSDHGQSQGATFRQRYGITLEQLVSQACEGDGIAVETGTDDAEALSYLSASLTEIGRDDTRSGRALDRATRRRKDSTGAVALELPEDQHPRRRRLAARRELAEPEPEPALVPAAPEGELPALSVMASGNLGLISFPREAGRVTLERINELHPKLIPALRSHPGIGFVMVRSEADGAVVLGADGVHYLEDGEVQGNDPLAPYGENAAQHVARTDSFPRCPDILVNSTYWADSDEVAAFEELVGSHGGLGGGQSHPFVLFPSDLPYPAKAVVGCENLHNVLRMWLWALGHESFAADRRPQRRSIEPPGSRTTTSTPGASSAT